MKRLIIGLLLVVCLLVSVTTCTTPAPTNSESASRIAELEARIRQLETENQRLLTENRELSSENQRLLTENRQLETENQRLLTENRQLNSDLETIANQLDVIQSLVSSSSYANMLSQLTEIQYDTNELAVFLESLPDLPPLPPGLDDISKVNDVITKAIFLRNILAHLPPLPPFILPPELYQLEDMKDTFIDMTEWMEDLEELPEFLNIAGDLDDVRYQEIDHLHNIYASTYDIIGILEQVRDTASGY